LKVINTTFLPSAPPSRVMYFTNSLPLKLCSPIASGASPESSAIRSIRVIRTPCEAKRVLTPFGEEKAALMSAAAFGGISSTVMLEPPRPLSKPLKVRASVKPFGGASATSVPGTETSWALALETRPRPVAIHARIGTRRIATTPFRLAECTPRVRRARSPSLIP